MSNDSENQKVQTPDVTVIIPAFNEEYSIGACLSAIQNQTYDNYEVILSDNGSTDETVKIARSFDGVTIVNENETQGSYAARNTAITAASGDVIAFTDADCVPDSRWLENGLKQLTDTDADLVGGNVVFTYADQNDPAQLFDSITNMQIEQNIKNRNVAKTANLFVYKDVLEDIGPFPNHLESGGDVYWTNKATDAGYILSYASDAIVKHPARTFSELLQKQHRVGRGQIQIRNIEGWNWQKRIRVAAWILSGFLPKPPHYLTRDLSRANISVTLFIFIQILLVAWVCRIVEAIGRIEYIVTEVL